MKVAAYHGTRERYLGGCRCRPCVTAAGEPLPRSERLGISASLVRRREKGRTKCREEEACRLCGRGWLDPVERHWTLDDHWDARTGARRKPTRHHLVPSRWFLEHPAYRAFENVDANIVPLCRPCHDDVEEDPAARARLRARLSQAEVSFAIQTIGRAWLDAEYPPGLDSGAGGVEQSRSSPGP